MTAKVSPRRHGGTEVSGVASPAAEMRTRLRLDLRGLVLPALLVLGLYVAVEAKVFPPGAVPSPARVGTSFVEWLTGHTFGQSPYYYTGTFPKDALWSAFRVVVGFLIGASMAVVVGVYVGWSRTFERLVDPLVQLLRPIPRTALLPLAIIVFGLGHPPSLFLVAWGTFLAAYVQVVTGVKLVGRDLKRAAYMLGASEWTVLRRVVIPGALPHIVVGIRVGLAFAWTLLILAEMIGSDSGFGYVLWRGYEFVRLDLVLLGMAVLGLFGFLSDRLILAVARRKLDWAQELAESRL